MHRTTRLQITDANPHLICVLCGGYFIDAATIIECLHSFCKTCILRYLETSKFCPICDAMVHKTRPHQNIRADKTLQDLVYKLVPGLYKNEMKRRRIYYATNPTKDAPKAPSEARGDEMAERFIYTADENISMSLECCQDGIPDPEVLRRMRQENLKKGENSPKNGEKRDIRYLQCPAAVTVAHLKKFIRLKYDLPSQYQIDLFHTGESLHESYTLMDIAYIYMWRRRGPLKLYYTIYERARKRALPEPSESTVTEEIPVKAAKKTEIAEAEKPKAPKARSSTLVKEHTKAARSCNKESVIVSRELANSTKDFVRQDPPKTQTTPAKPTAATANTAKDNEAKKQHENKKQVSDVKKPVADFKKPASDAKKTLAETKKTITEAKKSVLEPKKNSVEVKKPLQEVRKPATEVKKNNDLKKLEPKKPNQEFRRIEPKKTPVEMKKLQPEVKKVQNDKRIEVKKVLEVKNHQLQHQQQHHQPTTEPRKFVENGKPATETKKSHSVGRKQAEPKKLSLPHVNGHLANGHGAFDLSRSKMDDSDIFKIPRRDEPLNLVKKDKAQTLKLNGGFSPRPDLNVVT